MDFMSGIKIPSLSKLDKESCDKEITAGECLKVIQWMGSSKTPCNDGLTKELYLCLWEEIKDDLVKYLNHNFMVGSLSTTQKQIIITLIEKQGKDNRSFYAWRPISLINIDVKHL